jgi:hypothetical protein
MSMSFFQDVFVGIGALSVAFAVADMIRHYLPNYIRFLTAGLLLFTVDALIPQFSILTLPGVMLGAGAAAFFGIWFLRKRAIIGQDGKVSR